MKVRCNLGSQEGRLGLQLGIRFRAGTVEIRQLLEPAGRIKNWKTEMRDNIPRFNSIPPCGRMFNISRGGQG